MQLMTARARRRGRRRRRSASSATRWCDVDAGCAAVRSDCRRELRVWASHGDYVAARAARLRRRRRPAPTRRSRRWRTAARRLYALLFHPEVAHTEHGAGDPAQLRVRRLRLHAATGRWRRSSTRRSARIRAAGRRRPGGLRPERRRRLDGGRAAAPPGHRRPADLHLRRQRRAAAGRGGAGRASASTTAAAAARVRRTRRRCSSTGSPASPIPSRSARSSARTFIDVFEAEAHDARARSTSWRRARSTPTSSRSVSVVGPSADDQEPPQRRRPARAHALRAGRAAARAVQGRGARARPRARARRGVRLAPAVPGAGPGGAHPRRGHARRGSTCCARADAIVVEEVRRGRAGTARSGSASRCCCRCRASA